MVNNGIYPQNNTTLDMPVVQSFAQSLCLQTKQYNFNLHMFPRFLQKTHNPVSVHLKYGTGMILSHSQLPSFSPE
jgi:hypothetical protein